MRPESQSGRVVKIRVVVKLWLVVVMVGGYAEALAVGRRSLDVVLGMTSPVVGVRWVLRRRWRRGRGLQGLGAARGLVARSARVVVYADRSQWQGRLHFSRRRRSPAYRRAPLVATEFRSSVLKPHLESIKMINKLINF